MSLELVMGFSNADVLTAKLTLRPPSAGNPPTDITKDGLKHWSDFWKKYSKKIKDSIPQTIDKAKYHSKEDYMWATARAIFNNYCLKRNVQPYRSDLHQASDATIEMERKRLSGFFKNLTDLNRRVIEKVEMYNVLSRTKVTKDVVSEIKKKGKQFSVSTEARILIKENGMKDEFVPLMKSLGFIMKSKTIAVRETNSGNGVITFELKPDHIIVTKTGKMTPEQLKPVLGLKPDASEADIEKALGPYVKRNILTDKETSSGRHLLP